MANRRLQLLPLPAPDLREETVLDLADAYRRFAPVVAGRALRILGQREDADDLVQDVFVDAAKNIRGIREPKAILAWLIVATVRLARYRLRLRRIRRFFGLEDLRPYEELVDGTATPFQRMLVADVYRLLDRLPVTHRLAWTLRYVEGEELDAVASLSGCSLATAKRRVAAAQLAIEEGFAT